MRPLMSCAVVLAAISLTACGADRDSAEGAAEPSSRTVAETLRGESNFDRLEGLLTNAGLAPALEGTGPYTVFAPVDSAFAGGGVGDDLADEALRAQSAALLRAHVVPGALTRQDILSAIENAGDGSVEMRTMADTVLTFTREDSSLVVTAPDGARARLIGAETVAGNGAVQPIDALLAQAEAETAP